MSDHLQELLHSGTLNAPPFHLAPDSVFYFLESHPVLNGRTNHEPVAVDRSFKIPPDPPLQGGGTGLAFLHPFSKGGEGDSPQTPDWIPNQHY
jgi:hypothetical protein